MLHTFLSPTSSWNAAFKSSTKNLVIVVASSFTHWKALKLWWSENKLLEVKPCKVVFHWKILACRTNQAQNIKLHDDFKSSFCYPSPNFSKNMDTWAIVIVDFSASNSPNLTPKVYFLRLHSKTPWKVRGPPLHYLYRLDILWCNAEHNLQWSVLIRRITGGPPNPPNFEIWKFNYHSVSPDIQREQLAFQCFLR